ncbi:CRISPR-associated ring nuclease Csm6 [Nitrosomonas communis]|uniref:CRISPR-associated protein, NE0113 family n=1 Tax=Nitrosomonas communis TaxID=44574 RepID=A0A1I4RNJ4_9PROT|nr:CRISPR-associated ring nuclease Csm6 [Nitrosomonas communis]SFM53764.1 CRISPR-associated protein, NE0113 family [Nitrosomonas communis]
MVEMMSGGYSRRILLLVTGLTPQVVTETLYALAVQSKEKFIPTEIHVISTGEGAERARLSLLDPSSGQFHALCREYGLQSILFPPENIHVIEDTTGQPLTDIRTPEDNLRAADYTVHFIRKFCSDESSILHVSIAGGRKSMGFFAGYALSLFGRTQDRLSHVLVNDPFESLPDFYFPPMQGKVLYSRSNRPVHTSDARIMLADIPFVRLRGGIPQNLQDRKVSFHETVEEVQSGLRFISLSFDLPKKSICCGGKWIKLPPALFAFYLWLARRQVMTSGEGAIHSQEANHHDFLRVYADVVGSMSASLENTAQVLKNGFDRQFFEEKLSKINRIIEKSLPLEASFYQIATFGMKPYKKYGLRLTPDQISL